MQHTRTFNRISADRSRTASRPASTHRHSPYVRLAKKIFRRVKIQLAVYLSIFFLLPSLLGAGANDVILTLVYPAFCFFLATVYGYKYGFIKHYLVIPVALFTIASFFHFEAFSFLYGICYLMAGIIALAFGTIYRQLK